MRSLIAAIIAGVDSTKSVRQRIKSLEEKQKSLCGLIAHDQNRAKDFKHHRGTSAQKSGMTRIRRRR